VRTVLTAAFGQPAEADLVAALHAADAALVALVAVVDAAVVGHIMFSPMTHDDPMARVAGLGPMAVAPALQRSGIGGQLIREGLRRCAALGLDGVVVLGHADYYPRFGFSRADTVGLRCEYDVAPEHFMALALPGRTLPGRGGPIAYHPAFATI
jgi:putative acetyltransferase